MKIQTDHRPISFSFPSSCAISQVQEFFYCPGAEAVDCTHVRSTRPLPSSIADVRSDAFEISIRVYAYMRGGYIPLFIHHIYVIKI